jgi:hypothetical protein
MAKAVKTKEVFIDAGKGTYVTEDYAKKHKSTTVKMTVPVPTPTKKK